MGQGSVERLPSGRYRAVVRAGKDPITGRRVKLTETCETEREAIVARDRLLAQVDAEGRPDRAATVAVLMERWMEVADHELSTRETTEGYVRRTITPALGDMQVRKLQHRVDLLDRLYTHLRRCNVLCDGRPQVDHRIAVRHDCTESRCRPHVCKPMTPGAIRRIHAILSAALGYAVSWGWAERNPAQFAHPPKLNRDRARPPAAVQVARLLNLAWATNPEMAMFLWLAVTTGARRGELAGLRWHRVDMVNAELQLLRDGNYVVRGGARELKTTKTGGERRLSLDVLTVGMLRDFRLQRDVQLAPARQTLSAEAFVFSPEPACLRPWHPDHFTHGYRELADALGIAEPLKNLRHFNATQLLSAGVDVPTTAGRLGHADGGATTLRFYADWLPATDRKAAEQLSADLAALRVRQAGLALNDAGSAVEAAPPPAVALARAPRVLADVLDPWTRTDTTYSDIADLTRCAMDEGRLVSGDLMPTVTELAAWFHVARSTAQRAVKLLAVESRIAKAGHRWVIS